MHCSLDSSRSKNVFYRGIDCMEKFFADLKKYATELINYEEKEMLPSINEEVATKCLQNL